MIIYTKKYGVIILLLLTIALDAMAQDKKDTSGNLNQRQSPASVDPLSLKDIDGSVNVQSIQTQPFISLQQILTGRVAGLYVKESSGEPGSASQYMFLRGLRSPVFNKKDLYGQQPVVYLNGIPLIGDHPFIYNIQQYSVNPLGPATNLLTAISPDNIQSITVVKNPVDLAKLGPLAVNGAIRIETKKSRSGYRQISINSYGGLAIPPDITPINAAYIRDFRQPFYEKYANEKALFNYPAFLGDSTNQKYYGPARWNDLYSRIAPLYNVDFGLTSGSKNANFRFYAGHTRDAGVSDQTSFRKYTAAFFINMVPFSWLRVSSMISGARLDRKRNKNFRDRFAEMNFIPDLSVPPSPNKDDYRIFLRDYNNNVIDKNSNNIARGYVSVDVGRKALSFSSKFAFDYNESLRDVFWPSSLLEQINFVSNYFGYNQRIIWSNRLRYAHNWENRIGIEVEGGSNALYDVHSYNYAKGYDGFSDFIKVNSGNYLAYRYTDRERQRLFSFYGAISFKYKDLLKLDAVIREDGSSLFMASDRWLFTPSFSAVWNLKHQFLSTSSTVSHLAVSASWARIGRLLNSDRFSAGPQYESNIGWPQYPNLSSYNGMATLSRPYRSGWIGYNSPWPYSDQLNFNVNGSFFQKRLNVSLSFYEIADKRQLLKMPVAEELGYTGAYESGMAVNNKGIDMDLGIKLLRQGNGFNWYTHFNANVNHNELTALPGNKNEIVIGDRKFVVGQSIDAYWLLHNKGIYENDSDIPVNGNNEKMTVYGIPLKPGDPQWTDRNNDLNIDDQDKILMSHIMPVFTAGWSNRFRYKHFDFNFHILFAYGQSAINRYEASRYDFINTASSNAINSVDEIYFWQKGGAVEGDYPLYNPWSQANPYRLDQDLFLEDASYAKLRSITLGYRFIPGSKRIKTGDEKNPVFGLSSIYFYATGNNLLTVTPFNEPNPELMQVTGYYTGYNLPVPKSIIIGVRINL